MHMRAQARPRRRISRTRLRLLKPLVRYSYARDAYVLRGIGRHVGPVYRPTDDTQIEN